MIAKQVPLVEDDSDTVLEPPGDLLPENNRSEHCQSPLALP